MNQLLAKLTGLFLLFCCCFLAVEIVWRVFPSASAQSQAPKYLTRQAQGAASQQTTQHKNWNLTALNQAHIFGKQQVKKASTQTKQPVTAPRQPTQSVKPVTRLKLTLIGLVYAVDQQKASALIVYQRKQEVYQVNEKITNGVTIHAINEDHVVLNNRGNKEILRRSQSDSLASTASRRPASKGNLRDADNAKLSTGRRLRVLRDHIRENPNLVKKIADKYVRVRANKRNGQIIGYRVYPGRDRRLFNKSGLKSGDLVKSVNGIPVDNPLALAAEAESGSFFTLTVANRRGEERQVTLNLAE